MFHKEVDLNEITATDFMEFERKRGLFIKRFKRALDKKLEKIFLNNEAPLEIKPFNVNLVKK